MHFWRRESSWTFQIRIPADLVDYFGHIPVRVRLGSMGARNATAPPGTCRTCGGGVRRSVGHGSAGDRDRQRAHPTGCPLEMSCGLANLPFQGIRDLEFGFEKRSCRCPGIPDLSAAVSHLACRFFDDPISQSACDQFHSVRGTSAPVICPRGVEHRLIIPGCRLACGERLVNEQASALAQLHRLQNCCGIPRVCDQACECILHLCGLRTTR